MWDPAQYLRYQDERARPFTELLARVHAEMPAEMPAEWPAQPPEHADRPMQVVDLGCGPATLTPLLSERWPGARVVGVDSSAEMVAEARLRLAEAGLTDRVELVHADLRQWRPSAPVHVLVSNATLQWVPEHLSLLGRLLGEVVPGGWFAFQVPGNFGEPSHRILLELAGSRRWRSRLGAVPQPCSHDPQVYLDVLAGLGATVDAWETTYLHVLTGEDAVLTWMKGTGARPMLEVLGDQEQEEFLAEYGAALRSAYPRQEFGTVLPFRRVFAVARRAGDAPVDVPGGGLSG